MSWQVVGVGSGSGIPLGASQHRGGRWWHHQVGTGTLFVYDAGVAAPRHVSLPHRGRTIPGIENGEFQRYDVIRHPCPVGYSWNGKECLLNLPPPQGNGVRFHGVGAGALMVHVGVGAGDGSCPNGCSYHEIDGAGSCVNDDNGEPCGNPPARRGYNEPEPDCGWAGPAYKDSNGVWHCPQTAGCQPGQVKDTQGRCVSAGRKQEQCGGGNEWNPTIGKCVPIAKTDDDCETSELRDAVTGLCVPMCADFTRRINGLCPQIPNVVPPNPTPKPDPAPVKPPALSAQGAMPWLIGLGLLAGVGTLVYLASKNNPSPGATKAGPAKFNFKRRRRQLRR